MRLFTKELEAKFARPKMTVTMREWLKSLSRGQGWLPLSTRNALIRRGLVVEVTQLECRLTDAGEKELRLLKESEVI